MKFIWDEAKRKSNLKDHRLDFADAKKVFNGFMRVFEDTRFDYGEQRWVGVGLLGVGVVIVIYTETDEAKRIISMRKGTKNEQEQFYK